MGVGMRNVYKNSLVCAIGFSALVGCATPPEEMHAAYVSPTQFNGLNCAQLSEELERVSGREIELHAQLKTLADDDATQMGVGLILLWPTLFFLEGGDGVQAAEYSRLKGEGDAVEKMMIRNQCSNELMAPVKQREARRNIPNRLKTLEDLLGNGSISEEEYEQRRAKILDSI